MQFLHMVYVGRYRGLRVQTRTRQEFRHFVSRQEEFRARRERRRRSGGGSGRSAAEDRVTQTVYVYKNPHGAVLTWTQKPAQWDQFVGGEKAVVSVEMPRGATATERTSAVAQYMREGRVTFERVPTPPPEKAVPKPPPSRQPISPLLMERALIGGAMTEQYLGHMQRQVTQGTTPGLQPTEKPPEYKMPKSVFGEFKGKPAEPQRWRIIEPAETIIYKDKPYVIKEAQFTLSRDIEYEYRKLMGSGKPYQDPLQVQIKELGQYAVSAPAGIVEVGEPVVKFVHDPKGTAAAIGASLGTEAGMKRFAVGFAATAGMFGAVGKIPVRSPKYTFSYELGKTQGLYMGLRTTKGTVFKYTPTVSGRVITKVGAAEFESRVITGVGKRGKGLAVQQIPVGVAGKRGELSASLSRVVTAPRKITGKIPEITYGKPIVSDVMSKTMVFRKGREFTGIGKGLMLSKGTEKFTYGFRGLQQAQKTLLTGIAKRGKATELFKSKIYRGRPPEPDVLTFRGLGTKKPPTVGQMPIITETIKKQIKELTKKPSGKPRSGIADVTTTPYSGVFTARQTRLPVEEEYIEPITPQQFKPFEKPALKQIMISRQAVIPSQKLGLRLRERGRQRTRPLARQIPYTRPVAITTPLVAPRQKLVSLTMPRTRMGLTGRSGLRAPGLPRTPTYAFPPLAPPLKPPEFGGKIRKKKKFMLPKIGPTYKPSLIGLISGKRIKNPPKRVTGIGVRYPIGLRPSRKRRVI